MGKLMVVKDFLPAPDQLVLKEENIKVTISLNKSSVEFFKKEAQKHQTSYQRMIRRVIDWYASQYQKGIWLKTGISPWRWTNSYRV